MGNLKFINHLKGFADKIEIDVKNISALIEHPGEKGRNNEAILANFIRRIIPSKYEISTGFITDKSGALSKQVDLFIFNHLEFPDILRHESLSMFPVDWTNAVFEVKTKIWSKKDITGAIENIKSVKELSYDQREFQLLEPGEKNDGKSPKNYKNSAPLGFLVAFSSKLKFNTIIGTVENSLKKIKNKSLHPDIIVVLGKGFIKYPNLQHTGKLEKFEFPEPEDDPRYNAFMASIIYFTLLANNSLEAKKISPLAKGCLFDYLPEDFLTFPREIE